MVILRKIENNNCSLIKESKQVGKLYHICSLWDFSDYIVPNNVLSASGNYKNWVKGGRTDIISFTRDKSFVVKTQGLMFSPIIVQIEVDGDRLSEKYKIFPYNDLAFNTDTGERIDEWPEEIKNREKEECVIGPIKNFSSYITNITICVGCQSVRYILDVYSSLENSLSFFNSVKSIKMFPVQISYPRIPKSSVSLPSIEYPNFKSFVDSFSALNSIVTNSKITKSLLNKAFGDFSEVVKKEILKWRGLYINSNKNLLRALLKYDPSLLSLDCLESLNILTYKTINSMVYSKDSENPIIPFYKLENVFVKGWDFVNLFLKSYTYLDLVKILLSISDTYTFNNNVVSYIRNMLLYFLEKNSKFSERYFLDENSIKKMSIENMLRLLVKIFSYSTQKDFGKEVYSYFEKNHFLDLLNKNARIPILMKLFSDMYEKGSVLKLFLPEGDKTPYKDLLGFLNKVGFSDKKIMSTILTK